MNEKIGISLVLNGVSLALGCLRQLFPHSTKGIVLISTTHISTTTSGIEVPLAETPAAQAWVLATATITGNVDADAPSPRQHRPQAHRHGSAVGHVHVRVWVRRVIVPSRSSSAWMCAVCGESVD